MELVMSGVVLHLYSEVALAHYWHTEENYQYIEDENWYTLFELYPLLSQLISVYWVY